jgi:uncharacterized SAM-binding protein YcdF (DUF218 family)
MTDKETSKKDSSRSRTAVTCRLAGLIVLLTVFAVAVLGFRGAGRWLIREDPLTRSDVIVVLSGSMPYRAEEAAKVFRMGYAPEVWLTRAESPASEFEEMGIRYVGDEEYNREVLIHEGVPNQAIRVLPDTIADTLQEVDEIAHEARREGKTSVLIVTSPEHTRRVKAIWRKRIGENPKLLVHGAPQDPFDKDHWWRNTRDTFSAAREFMGLMNAWAGFPVQPHSH